MKITILLAVAVAGIFTLAASAYAGDAVMSPRAQEQANSLKKVSGTTPDMIDHSIVSGSPRANEQAASLRTVLRAGSDIDLAHAPRPLMSPKDPRYAAALRENAINQQIQVAPLK